MNTTTFKYILENADWDKFCEIKGYNPWMLNEGLATGDEETILTFKEAEQVGMSIEIR